jgi:gas vesicle protein
MNKETYFEEETGYAAGWSTFMAGALIGAGIALMFAPQAGSELRGTLRNYANRAKDDLVEKGQEAWDTAVERGKDYYHRGEEALSEANRSAREFVKQGKDAGREAVQSVQEGRGS